MNIDEFVNALTDEQYQALKQAVELGKWPDGRVLDQQAKEESLQVLIAYDAKYKTKENRIGYLHKEKKTDCETSNEPETLIIKN